MSEKLEKIKGAIRQSLDELGLHYSEASNDSFTLLFSGTNSIQELRIFCAEGYVSFSARLPKLFKEKLPEILEILNAKSRDLPIGAYEITVSSQISFKLGIPVDDLIPDEKLLKKCVIVTAAQMGADSDEILREINEVLGNQ